MAVVAVSWTSASEADYAALQRFICTDPATKRYEPHRGKHHPRMYELEVQSHVRGLRLPRPSDEMLLLGLEDGEVVAASHLAFDSVQADMRVLAIATSLSHQGSGLGGEILDLSMAVMAETRDRHDLDCGAFAYVHPANMASKRLFSRRGWEPLDVYDGYEAWVHDLEGIVTE